MTETERAYRDRRVPAERYSRAWDDVYAFPITRVRGRRPVREWIVELKDGDPMGGSRNTVLRMSDERFRERYEAYDD